MKIKSLIKHAIYWILIFSFHNAVKSQNPEQTKELAKNQVVLGNYDNAIYYYQRVLFFEKDSNKSEIYQNLGDCYMLQGKYSYANEYYDIASFAAVNDTLKSEIVLKKVVCLWNRNKFQLAQAELLSNDTNVVKIIGEKINLYLGITYFGLNDLEKTNKYLTKFFEEYCSQNKDSFQQIFEQMKKIKKYNIKKSKILSGIVPGLGQLSIGEYRNAANSFTLNLVLLGLMVATAYYYGPIDALLSIAPWGFRYYIGGIRISGNLTEQKINRQKQICLNELINLMKKCD